MLLKKLRPEDCCKSELVVGRLPSQTISNINFQLNNLFKNTIQAQPVNIKWPKKW